MAKTKTVKKPKAEAGVSTVAEPIVPKLIGLDLGCGQNKVTKENMMQQMNVVVDEVWGVDFVPIPGSENHIVHNLTHFPYPFEDNSVDAIFSSHFAEHLDGFERAKFMDECWRILKPGGKMRLIHPYYKSVRAVQDFTHKWPPISENSYLYWDRNWRAANGLTHGYYELKCDYEFNIYYTWQDAVWGNKNEETRNYAVNHYFNVVADMIVDLKKRP
jgi:predicted SAM-dependent methyltransferase